MATLNFSKAVLATKYALLAGMGMPGENQVSVKIDGAHGEGKTAAAHAIAKELGGECLVVEGGSLKEGELTGLPYANTTSDGRKEVNFVPYYQIAAIQRLERDVYARAQKGLLGGTVILDENGDVKYKEDPESKEFKTATSRSRASAILEGEVNAYKFGDNLPFSVKLKLLKSKEITPVVLFFDEINRTDTQTAKELMNIILTKSVNGYKFPWWVFVVSAVNPCGQDSQYAVNEFDPAQMDRFLTIQFKADPEEWQNFAIESDLNQDYIIALATNSEIFTSGIKNNENEYETSILPTPRSHTICAYLYGAQSTLAGSGFFNPAEMKAVEESILRYLMEGKIGRRAAALMMKSLKNREDYIDPLDMIDGKSDKIKDKYVEKLKTMKSISKRILAGNVIKAMSTTLIKTYFDRSNPADPEKAKKAKEKWENIFAQTKQFYDLCESSIQSLFAYLSVQTQVNIDDPKYAKYNKQTIFLPISKVLSQEMVDQLAARTLIVKTGGMDKQ